MQMLLRAVASRWVISAIGIGSAGVLNWLYGPFLSMFEGVMPRVVAIVVLSLVWLLGNVMIDQLHKHAEARLAGGVLHGGAPPPSPPPQSAPHGRAAAASPVVAEEIAEQRERLGRAMTLLRKSSGRRGYLYEQPWYVIIGPPGAGKTTALANAGLRFPLSAELGAGEVKGVGGTRLCDWTFTDEAVLIDTAGRYTTQDSDAAVDKAGWEAFLSMLRRTRPRQPLNGVIVAIAATDLALATEAERLAHARAIRLRLKELNTRLGVRLPVYVVLTKLDLILGFTDFFDDLDQEKRSQVWGMTFPVEGDTAGPAGGFLDEFRALTTRLSERVIDRLQAERSPERRVAIADFPTQFASLEVPLAAFVDAAFGGTRLDPAPFLRGIYFASGTQEGSPIDRLTGALARGFGIDQRRAELLRPQRGRGYFLETLLKQVIFGEAMLVVRNPRAARRRRLLRGAAWAVAGLVMLGGVAAVWRGSAVNDAMADRFAAALEAYHRAVDTARLDPVPLGGADLPHVVPLLDQARALPFGPDDRSGVVLDVGLNQRDKLATAARLAYRRGLLRILLPRLISLTEARMYGHITDPDYLYNATRVYLILGGFGPLDRAMVHSWLQTEWEASYAGVSLAPLRASLLRHVDALLSAPLDEFVQLDGTLLAQARAQIGRVSVAARAYAVIRTSGAAQAAAPFVPSEAAGVLTSQHFVRRSGKSMSEPVPGLFTTAGYRTVLLPSLAKVTEQVMQESWVLGKETRVDPNDVAARQQIERGMLALYARDYIATWDGLLGDIDIVPPDTAASAVMDFSVLTSPQGPIALLLGAVVKELAPGAPPPAQPEAKPAAAAAAPADPAITAIDDHYRPLRELVQQGQLESELKAIDRLQQQISQQMAATATAGAPALPAAADAAAPLLQLAASTPEPMARWLRTLAQHGGAARDDAERSQAAAMLSGGGAGSTLATCQAMVQRFPFKPTAREDASLEDFALLFAPNGRFDAFYTQFLQPYVDTSGKLWKLRVPISPRVAVTEASIPQFQRALTIRDTFFGLGGKLPMFSFALHPLSASPPATQVMLDFGGITATWSQSATVPVQTFEWPGPTRMASVGVDFTPPGNGPTLEQTGPWALFRLLAQGKLVPVNGGESYQVTLGQGDREARFTLSTAGLHSPFDSDLFTGFKCPSLRP